MICDQYTYKNKRIIVPSWSPTCLRHQSKRHVLLANLYAEQRIIEVIYWSCAQLRFVMYIIFHLDNVGRCVKNSPATCPSAALAPTPL